MTAYGLLISNKIQVATAIQVEIFFWRIEFGFPCPLQLAPGSTIMQHCGRIIQRIGY